jgi:hypothetical protein
MDHTGGRQKFRSTKKLYGRRYGGHRTEVQGWLGAMVRQAAQVVQIFSQNANKCKDKLTS